MEKKTDGAEPAIIASLTPKGSRELGLELPKTLRPVAYLSLRDGDALGPRAKSTAVGVVPGLYLMAGGAGSGKTVTGLAIALSECDEDGNRFHDNVIAKQTKFRDASEPFVAYKGMLEPRISSTFGILGSAKLIKETIIVGESTGKGSKQVAGMFNPVRAFHEVLAEVKAANRSFCVIDSLTNLLPMVGAALLSVNEFEDTTMKEGVKRSDIMGTMFLNALCAEMDIAVFAMLNSELFPRVDVLEGTSEGRAVLQRPGAFELRDRQKRRFDSYSVADDVMSCALTLLKYPSFTVTTSQPSLDRIR